MSLKVYSKIAVFATIIALLYIHMQMNIFELAYNGKDKEKIIHELSDSNGALDNQILTLKSANNLGNRLLDSNDSLEFMNNERVVTVSAPGMPLAEPKPKAVNPLWNVFSFLGAQEAKAGQ